MIDPTIPANTNVTGNISDAPQHGALWTIIDRQPVPLDSVLEPKIKCICCKKSHYSDFVKHGRVNNKIGMICFDCRAKGKGR